MSMISKIINEKELNTFSKIKEFFCSEPYKMVVKGDENRCILLANKYHTLTDIIKDFDGCVLDIPNMIVLCNFPYLNRIELTKEYEEKELDNWDDYMVEELIDGSVLRLYYDDEWKIATLHTMDAKNAYWSSDKSFKTLFLECAEQHKLNLDTLNKTYVYGFVIRHPENKIVTHYEHKDLVHIMTLDRDNDFRTVDVDLKIVKPRKLIFTTLNQMIESCKNLQFYLPGYLLTDKNNTKTKYIAPHYNFVRQLKGNTPNLRTHYLNVRNNKDMCNSLVLYFPECIKIFSDIEKQIMKKVTEIYEKYVDIKIRKKYYELDKVEKYLIYKIHENYLTSKIPVRFQTVYYIFNQMPVYKIAMALEIPLNNNLHN